MNKKETLKRKIERNIKSVLRRQEIDINSLRREFCTSSPKSFYNFDTNNPLIISKKKKMDLRLMRYLS